MSYMHKIFDPKKHSRYSIKNKNKYIGKEIPICRSKLEKGMCEILDLDKKIVQWSSENLYIPYMYNNKLKKYFPDYWAKIKTPMFEEIWLIEVKHSKESNPPIKGKSKSRKTLLYEKYTWEKNIAKWKAAQNYCNKLGWKFKIFTEKEIFGRYGY